MTSTPRFKDRGPREELALRGVVRTGVIIAAAGSGTRLGLGSKALVRLNGRTTLARVVELFLGLDEVDQIVVVGPPARLEKARADKVLAHEEIRCLDTALGSGFGSSIDLSKLRYHRIIIMTDADVDGAHIRTLLLTFFFRNMRELIEHGFLFIAQPPLYRAKNGREQVGLRSEQGKNEYFAKFRDSKRQPELQRYKGLGEMNPEQLWETTMDPRRRTVLKVDIEDAILAEEIFSQLMGDDVSHRKRFIQAHSAQVRNLDV